MPRFFKVHMSTAGKQRGMIRDPSSRCLVQEVHVFDFRIEPKLAVWASELVILSFSIIEVEVVVEWYPPLENLWQPESSIPSNIGFPNCSGTGKGWCLSWFITFSIILSPNKGGKTCDFFWGCSSWFQPSSNRSRSDWEPGHCQMVPSRGGAWNTRVWRELEAFWGCRLATYCTEKQPCSLETLGLGRNWTYILGL